MYIDIISYKELQESNNVTTQNRIKDALCGVGIIGISDVPGFKKKSHDYIQSARQFTSLEENIKQQYAPNRDIGETEGYELGAEWFKDEAGNWQIDDKKSSFYAFVPDHKKNKWPHEVNLKTSYLALGELIFLTGKKVLHFIGLNENMNIPHNKLTGYGRMLHYHKLGLNIYTNPNWCGAHFDHGVFTGLIPAYYFLDGTQIDEPEEAGLFILPTHKTQFEKVNIMDKNIILFQVGEFGQLASHDQIRATKHLVKSTKKGIERYTFALFYSLCEEVVIQSKSELIHDARYTNHCSADGSICYGAWEKASYDRYRAIKQFNK